LRYFRDLSHVDIPQIFLLEGTVVQNMQDLHNPFEDIGSKYGLWGMNKKLSKQENEGGNALLF